MSDDALPIDLLRPLTRLQPGSHPGGIWVNPIYRDLGYPDALRDVWIRADVVPPLLRAALSARRHGHGLLLWDGWRSIGLQRILYEESREELRESTRLTGDALADLVGKFVTSPDRHASPPAHSTGGTIDLTLCDPDTGEPRDLGGEFDELTERSHPAYYDRAVGPVVERFAALRQELEDAMSEAGFVRLPTEWWHFEYGTALWSRETGQPILFERTAGPIP